MVCLCVGVACEAEGVKVDEVKQDLKITRQFENNGFKLREKCHFHRNKRPALMVSFAGGGGII